MHEQTKAEEERGEHLVFMIIADLELERRKNHCRLSEGFVDRPDRVPVTSVECFQIQRELPVATILLQSQ
jgi:hypothetical protein